MLASLLLSVQEWAGFTLGSPVDAVTMLQSTGSLPSRSALPAGRSAATLRDAYHDPWWFSPRNGSIGHKGRRCRVRTRGFEPPPGCPDQHLKLACLPDSTTSAGGINLPARAR